MALCARRSRASRSGTGDAKKPLPSCFRYILAGWVRSTRSRCPSARRKPCSKPSPPDLLSRCCSLPAARPIRTSPRTRSRATTPRANAPTTRRCPSPSARRPLVTPLAATRFWRSFFASASTRRACPMEPPMRPRRSVRAPCYRPPWSNASARATQEPIADLGAGRRFVFPDQAVAPPPLARQPSPRPPNRRIFIRPPVRRRLPMHVRRIALPR